MTRIASGLLLGFACLVFPLLAFAQAPLTLGGEAGGVDILADHIEQVGPELTVATGNVEITRGATRLTADRVEINRETGEAVALGKAIFYDGQDRLTGGRIDYNLKTGTGVIYDGSAFSAPYHRISGERMERVGEGLYNVQRGVFTNCEADPPFWSFRLGQATADLDDHISGRDASFWLEALKIPLIPWVPFFAAPIRRERETGFLLPTLGNSNEKGFFARIPFYWAISDSQDATFALDPYSKRGPGADLEYRYILSETNRGEARGFGIQETERGNDTRGQVVVKHDWQVTPRWSFKADGRYVSDDLFLRQYADRLSDRSLQWAQTKVSASWRGESWNLVANGFWYQDLTTTQHVELQRLPEIRLQGLRQPVPGTPLLFEVQSGYTNFLRDVGSEGQRADLHPRMLLPVSAGGFFTLTPFVGGRGTLYDKTVVGSQVSTGGVLVEVTEDTPRTRALGEAGADLEARVARIFDAGGALGISRLQHLIEPRVNYTFIDGVNRNKLPQWEPGGGVVNPLGIPLAEFGIDRLPKLSRFTYSLTNRLNAKPVADGGEEGARWELIRFALGQTYDFFPPFGGKPFGNVTGELTVQPGQYFKFRGNAGYDVHGEGFQSVNTDVSVMIRDVTATAGTRFDHSAQIEFVTGQIQAKLTRNLDAHSSIQYDVHSGTPVEMRFGLDILCQCVSFTLEYVRREGTGLARNEDEVHFSVNLLGLGRFGSKAGLGAIQ